MGGGDEVSSSHGSSGYKISDESASQSSDDWKYELLLNIINKHGSIEDKNETDHELISMAAAYEFDQTMKRRKSQNTYLQVLQSYHHESEDVKKSVDVAKEQVHSYYPGAWMDNDNELYYIPARTKLLLVGPIGSGKSNLINRISSLFKQPDDLQSPARAQVSNNVTGTLKLHGYTIPKGLKSVICLYDTPGLCDTPSTASHDKPMPERVIFNKDVDRGAHRDPNTVRGVNFIIFVVSAVPVLRAITLGLEEDKHAMQMLARIYNSPDFSFGDDKPVVVMTHGDLLSVEDRAKVRTHLGELFEIPPLTQIFDIPESADPSTDLAMLDMLKYSLEHADKNLHRRVYHEKKKPNAHISKSVKVSNREHFLLLFFPAVFIIMTLLISLPHFPSHKRRSNSILVHGEDEFYSNNKTHLDPTWNSDKEVPVNVQSTPDGEKWTSRSNSDKCNLDQPTTMIKTEPSNEAHQQQPYWNKEELKEEEDQIQGKSTQKHKKVRGSDENKRPNCEQWDQGDDEEVTPQRWRRDHKPCKMDDKAQQGKRNRNCKQYGKEEEDWKMNGRHRLWLVD